MLKSYLDDLEKTDTGYFRVLSETTTKQMILPAFKKKEVLVASQFFHGKCRKMVFLINETVAWWMTRLC
jgi:hypothetical protein